MKINFEFLNYCFYKLLHMKKSLQAALTAGVIHITISERAIEKE